MFLLVCHVSLLIVVSHAVLFFPDLKQKFIIEPSDQLVNVGSKVTLKCKVKNINGTVQWTKDHVELGIGRNLTGHDRYKIVGSDVINDWDLEINPMTVDDEGKYQCQVTPGSPAESEIRSRPADLLVMIVPDPPKIMQGDYLVTYGYRETTLQCTSYGGRPPAYITWSDDEGNVLASHRDILEDVPAVKKRYTRISILKFIAKPNNFNRTYFCYAKHISQNKYQFTKIKVEVKYPPKVDLVFLSGVTPEGKIPEGTDVRFECRAQANPFNVTYSWFLNGEIIVGNFTSEWVLRNVTKDYHHSIVKCEVSNQYGSGEEIAILDVFSGPKFHKRPESIEADLSDTVTLNCDVIGNPPPFISWLYGDPLVIVGHDVNFSVRVTPSTVGQYFCIAYIQGYAYIEAEATIYMKDIPFIESERFQFGVVHDTVQMECSAISIPAPDLVIWTFNGFEVRGPEFTILEDSLPQGMRSTLIIRDSETRHFGRYNCTIINAYGSDTLLIDLQQPDLTEEWIMVIFNIVFTALLVCIMIMLVVAFILYTRGCEGPIEGNRT